MHTTTCWIIAVMMTMGILVERSYGQVKVLTVCEVLGNVARYADSGLAVVGRMEGSVGLIDHSEFLSQDQCKHRASTRGHVWSDRIHIWTAWEAGMPKPPRDRPNIERSVVASKLLMVRKTTELGFHQEPQFKADGHSIVYTRTGPVPNEWAIVCGRIVRAPHLNKDCGVGGCGGDNVPLAIIAEPFNVHRLAQDSTPLPEAK